MNISFFLQGFIIGISIAAPVGPIGVLCIRRTLANGRTCGLVSGLGAATADAIYGCCAAFGLTIVSNFLLNQQKWLQWVGGIFLCCLGVKTFFAKASKIGSNDGDIKLLGAFASTFVLTLTNPITILSFAAIFAGIGLGGPQRGFPPAFLMVNGVFFGSIVWWTVLSGSVAAIQSRLNPVRLIWINRISGLIIASFGLWILAGLTRR